MCAVPKILSLPRRGVWIPPWRRMEHTTQKGHRELGWLSLQARRKGDLTQSSTTWRVTQRRWNLTFLRSGQLKIEEMFINHSWVWGESAKKSQTEQHEKVKHYRGCPKCLWSLHHKGGQGRAAWTLQQTDCSTLPVAPSNLNYSMI